MATYTLRGRVTEDHRLEVELPPETPPGEAEVTVTVRGQPGPNSQRLLALFERWAAEPLGGKRRTRAEVDIELNAMRDEWDRD